MELPEKTPSNFTDSTYTISPGIMEEMSSRLQIVDCENGKSQGKPKKKQYDRTGHETGGGNAHGIQSDHPTSPGETFMHLLRGNIGAGLFGMGDAFRNGGIILAPILTVCIGLIAVHCQHILMSCAEKMAILSHGSPTEKNEKIEQPDYAETVELCLRNGPPGIRKWSRFTRFMVDFFICLTQLGFCCIYFVFIGTNFAQLWNHYNILDHEFDLYCKIVLILLPILCISMITELKYLAPLSTIANICMACGLALTLYFAFQDVPSITEREYVGTLSQLPLFFGTAIFAFEGIALVLPLKNAMKKPKKFSRPHGVLNIGMVVVASLYIVFGFIGYLKWGSDVKGSMTLNLPQEDPLAQTVKLMVSLGLLMSYPLQFFVAISIMWPAIEERRGPLKYPMTSQRLFRVLLVLFTFALAENVPELNSFISLIGALCSSGLALVFPPLIELVLAYGSSGRPSPFLLSKNLFILCLALFGLVTGTFESLNAIISAFQGKKATHGGH